MYWYGYSTVWIKYLSIYIQQIINYVNMYKNKYKICNIITDIQYKD